MANVDDKIVVIRKKDRIEYILSGICDYYDMRRSDFIKYVRRPERFNRKRIAMQILYDIADCSLKDVRTAMGYSPSTDVSNVQRQIVNLREDLLYNKSLNKEYKNVLNHLKL
jgi:chromosomal replication initiation ATPase DnaA